MADRKQPAQRGASGVASSPGGPRRLGGQASAPRTPSAGAQRRAQRQRSRQRSSRWMGWGAVAVVVVVAVVLAVIFAGSSSPKKSGSGSGSSSGVATGQHPALASTAYVRAITTIPASTYDSVGTDSLGVPFVVTKGQPPLLKGGKPEFIYEGAEYCPYCAMMRYSLVAALSRFGTFSNLKQTSSGSSDGDVPTFSFLGSTYTSKYVTFSPWETLDRQEPQSQPLQTPPAYVTNLYKKYDGDPASGTAAPTFNPSGSAGIPFLDIGNKYVSAGDPQPFLALWQPGGPLSNGGPGRLAIANGIHDPTSSTGQYVHGELFVAQANYISAAICSVDGNKPAAVCGSPGVTAAAKALAKSPQVG